MSSFKLFEGGADGTPRGIVVAVCLVARPGVAVAQVKAGELCEQMGCKGFTGGAPLVIVVEPKNVHFIK